MPEPTDSNGSALVQRLVDARVAGDQVRAARILLRAARAGDAVAHGIAQAVEDAASLDDEAQELVVAAAVDAAMATRGMLALSELIHVAATHDDDLGGEIGVGLEMRLAGAFEEVLERTPDDPRIAGLLALRADLAAAVDEARPETGRALATCHWLLGLTPSGTPGVLDALLGDLDADPVSIIPALRAHGDGAAASAVRDWLDGIQYGDGDSGDLRWTIAHTIEVLEDWDVEATPRGYAKAVAANEDMERHIRRMSREAARELERVQAEMRALPRERTLDRATTGPNAPCDCGSGRKRKRCCG